MPALFDPLAERDAITALRAAGDHDAARRRAIALADRLLADARTDDAIGVLGDAVLAEPDDAPARAFLALALHAAGHHALAVATLLETALVAAPAAFAAHRDQLAARLNALHAAAVP